MSETAAHLVHAQPGEIRDGELYWDKGFYFFRMFDGTVRVRLAWGTTHATVMIPREQWSAIVAHVAEETGEITAG